MAKPICKNPLFKSTVGPGHLTPRFDPGESLVQLLSRTTTILGDYRLIRLGGTRASTPWLASPIQPAALFVVNKALLEHSHTYSLRFSPWMLSYYCDPYGSQNLKCLGYCVLQKEFGSPWGSRQPWRPRHVPAMKRLRSQRPHLFLLPFVWISQVPTVWEKLKTTDGSPTKEFLPRNSLALGSSLPSLEEIVVQL